MRDVLGLPLEVWGGAALRYDAPKHPPVLAWNPFPATTQYFAPSTSAFMINYSVDDMGALLERLRAKGVEILKRDENDPKGALRVDSRSGRQQGRVVGAETVGPRGRIAHSGPRARAPIRPAAVKDSALD
ncbi:MAG TPA: hypothetical protein VGM84_28160 [Steroidobacteraceae bacterium]|jgi:catechol 2,3-dioxygenase-like lactoylglutathione lyase family enzyme